jgi:toxin-antitoxin system PIN domain toxin
MLAPDVNVLVYAHRAEVSEHAACRLWLERVVNADAGFGLADVVVSGFLRIVTHPRIFRSPTPLVEALAEASALRGQPNRVPLEPGPRHWSIFERICRDVRARGNLVADAYLAALAIESGCEWVTLDRDYSRFPGLSVRSPLG